FLVLAIALALGGLGVHLSRQYIEEQIAFYKAQLEKTEPMAKVVVAARDLLPGEVLVAGDLAEREMPVQYIDSNAVQTGNYEVALGQRVGFRVERGHSLLWAHLEGGLTPTFSGKVENGHRAMTVRVDEVNSISGFLQPGDRVDLLLGYGRTNRETEIFPLIQNLEVIATGVQTSVDKAGAHGKRSFTTITVHVSPEDAQKLTLAQTIGKLTATLRNPDDTAPLDEAPMTVARLLEQEKPSSADVDKPATPRRVVRARPARPSRPRIQYIIGGR
ncbi:MAG: Flp pilus assembly protein CpaB, partial [Gammaproteobacteria bacterium]